MRVVLADDHKLMRDGLRALLERAGIQVVGEAATGHEAVARTHALRPDVVVMDISMPDLNGIDATRRIVADSPGTKVVGLSMNSDRRYVLAMFDAGAVGYLLKNSASEELIQAVQAVAQDMTYVSPAIASIIVGRALGGRGAPESKTRPLTVREREVLQLLAEGRSSKEIATRLDLAVPTVETHRRQIMDKLNLRTIAELTKFAIREGLTALE